MSKNMLSVAVVVLMAAGAVWAQPEKPAEKPAQKPAPKQEQPGKPEERKPEKQPEGAEEEPKFTMTLESASIVHDTQMPKRHTIDGEEGKGKDVSPHLKWGKAPEGTKEFAVVMFDPDARGFVHWVIYGIPANVTELPEGLPGGKDNEVLVKPVTATQGTNMFRQIGYRGPAARKGGGVHRYRFRVYALDTELKLKPGATRQELDAAMKGHVLAEGELIGRNER
jgi:Raf kinase inhibitor-like YbhB/YbcL family protein